MEKNKCYEVLLSMEALKFYGRFKNSTEETHFYGTAMLFVRSTHFLVRKKLSLFPQNSYVSMERSEISMKQSQIYKECLHNFIKMFNSKDNS